jgi:hypothetical protein
MSLQRIAIGVRRSPDDDSRSSVSRGKRSMRSRGFCIPKYHTETPVRSIRKNHSAMFHLVSICAFKKSCCRLVKFVFFSPQNITLVASKNVESHAFMLASKFLYVGMSS